MIQTYIPYIALSISLIALYYGFRGYLLKSGIKIQGIHTICSSVDCDDKYIHRVMLENLKDRATTIYGIYLKVGYGCYIEIEDFEDSPHILKAFESYQQEFDAIEFYSVSSKRIRLNALLDDKHVKQRLYLSTASGKYKVKKSLRRWNPVSEFFRNHLTAVVRPIRSKYKERAYGSNIRYLVELKFRDDNEQVIPIHSTEYNWRRYRNFKITRESLASKGDLNAFFLNLIDENKIHAESVKIYDLNEWRDKIHDFNKERPVLEAKRYSWIKYYLMGRIFTYLGDRKLRIMNAKNKNNNA